jgi:hypothetical protein
MNTIKLGENTFCGPSVISAIAGIDSDEAAALLSSITGKVKIKAVYLEDLMKALKELGYSSERIRDFNDYSVFKSLFSIRDGMYVYLVVDSMKEKVGHFIAIEVNGSHRYICDNHTKSPINISSSARLGMKVRGMIKVVKDECLS